MIPYITVHQISSLISRNNNSDRIFDTLFYYHDDTEFYDRIMNTTNNNENPYNQSFENINSTISNFHTSTNNSYNSSSSSSQTQTNYEYSRIMQQMYQILCDLDLQLKLGDIRGIISRMNTIPMSWSRSSRIEHYATVPWQ